MASRTRILLLAGLAASALAAGGTWTLWRLYDQRAHGAAAPAGRTGAAPTRRTGAASAGAAEDDRWPLARLVPASTLAFAAARDLPDAMARAGQTPAGRLARSPAARQALAIAASLAPPAARTTLPVLRGRLAELGACEFAVALTELEAVEQCQPVPHVLLAVRGSTGTDGAALAKLAEDAFATLRAGQPSLVARDKDYDAQTPMHLLGDDEVILAWAVRDGTLLAASHEATLRQALDLAAGKGAPLGTLASFRDCAETADCRDAFLYANLALLRARLPSANAPSEASWQQHALDAADAVAFGAEIAPPVFVERAVLHTARKEGFLALLDNPPVSQDAPPNLPEGLRSCGTMRCAPPEAWDNALKALKQVNPADHADLLAQVEGLNRRMGFRLREDLLASLGDRTTFVVSPGNDPLHPDWVLTLGLRDPARASRCLDHLAEGLRRIDPALARTDSVEGKEVLVIAAGAFGALTGAGPAPETGGLPPLAMAVRDDVLVITGRPQLAARQAAKGETAPPKAISDALDPLPNGAWAWCYTDVASSTAGALPGLLRQMSDQGMPLPPGAEAMLSQAAAASQDLPPWVVIVSATPKGFVLESRGPVPAASLLGIGIPAAIVLPMLLKDADRLP